MIKFNKWSLILVIIIFLAVLLRFYKLETIPIGFHFDEASQAYNAFSLGTTGHDRFGQYFPLMFRSFGSYQPPIYTYLLILPVKLLGNTIFAARFISAFFGVIVIVFTYLIIVELVEEKLKHSFGLMAALMVSISPWAIHFSRRVVEANVGLGFFVASFYFLIRSLKSVKLFPLAMFLIGVSTHAYYSERVLAIIFVPIYLSVFRQYYLKQFKIVLLGLIVFGLTQLPHLYLFATGAYANRFSQVSYLGNSTGGLSGVASVIQQLLRHFLIYISPHYLFADAGSDLARIAPDLGVFYAWLFIPFLIGIVAFIRRANTIFFKIILLAIPVFLVPACLTGDLFYPLRILEYLWVITIIIAFGLMIILRRINFQKIKLGVLSILIVYSLFIFYLSYAVLYKYETNENDGQVYVELVKNLEQYNDKRIVVDTWRDNTIGLRIAYFKKYNADKLANNLQPQIISNYYDSKISVQETYQLDNWEFRPIEFGKDTGFKGKVLVGDSLAITDDQAFGNKLTPLFEIKNNNGSTAFKAYASNPD